MAKPPIKTTVLLCLEETFQQLSDHANFDEVVLIT